MWSKLDDTIVALATAPGEAGLAVIRVAGPRAFDVASQLFRGANLATSPSHQAHHGFIVNANAERIDEVLALVLRQPRSYTGDDTVEFSCHGSPQVVEEVVGAALQAGARVAEPGEFTRRAFLNGKLDLTQVEAVADLIYARSQAARRAALEQLQGRLTARLEPVRRDLIDLLGDVEASIDFVEEGIEFFDAAQALSRARDATARVQELLATALDGLALRSGVRVSLAGSPNVGKSRLFNCLVQDARSIVTEHPGTTRDVVRELIRPGGIAMLLEDTAGIRNDADDPVELLGIERSRRSHAEADVVLLVLDASRPLQADERRALADSVVERTIVVHNKIDVLTAAERDAFRSDVAKPATLCRVAVSAATGEGVEQVFAALQNVARVKRLTLQNEALLTINQRHQEALMRAHEGLVQFERDARAGEPAEILAADLRNAITPLREISGEQFTEEVLTSIFARFCIGK